MFCTKCGRELLKDGTPCVCGSGQAELIIQNDALSNEWAEDVAPLFTQEEEPEIVADEEIPEPEPVEETAEEIIEEVEDAIEEFFKVAEAEQPMWTQAPVEPAQQETYLSPDFKPLFPQPEYYYGMPGYAIMQENPVRTAVRGVLGSPLFLVAAIITSVSFALSIANIFIPIDVASIANAVTAAINAAVPGVGDGLLSEFEGNLVQLQSAIGTFSFGTVMGLIPSALGVLALWLIYGSSKREHGPKTGGLVILQILRIFKLIGAAFFVLVSIVCGVLVFVYLQSLLEDFIRYGVIGGDLPQMIMAIAMSIVGVLFVYTLFNLFYMIATLSTVSRVRKAVKTGIVMKKASRFVMIVCWISAIVTLVGVYTSLMVAGPIVAAMDLAKAATNILFALCIAKYNKAIKPFIVK